jgi:hypothetical protein
MTSKRGGWLDWVGCKIGFASNLLMMVVLLLLLLLKKQKL